MTDPTRELEKLEELAVDRLLGMLSDEDAAEYRRLRDRHPDFDDHALERAAAALHLATGIVPEPMPAGLQRRLEDGAETFSAGRGRPPAAATTHGLGWQAMTGWLAAAACLGAAIATWLDRPSHTMAPSPPPAAPRAAQSAPERRPAPPAATATASTRPTSSTPANAPVSTTATTASAGTASTAATTASGPAETDPASARTRLLAANAHLVQRAWRAGGDPAGLQVSGDVVWDPASQTGYMRFVGLRRNEPNAEQYQLWIFDATRDERYPVDGGVFNVSGGRGGDVIPITPKLPIGVALMFAVTIERRGGVVVSDRERIVAIANTT
jgi:hypothetical protein